MLDSMIKIERDYLMALMSRDSLPDHVRLDPAELSVIAHRDILQAIYDCEESTGAWDHQAVYHHLRLQKSKNCSVMENMIENWEFQVEAEPRLKMIREYVLARTLHSQADKVVEAFDDNRILDGLELAQELAATKPSNDEGYQPISIGQAMKLAREEVGEVIQGRSTRMKFGIWLLDNSIGGVTPGSMTTIGGTTGSGKSSLSLLLAVQLARKNTRVGILSLEDPETLWGDRLLSYLADIPTSWIYTGAGLDDYAIEDFKARADKAQEEANKLSIMLSICTGATANEAVRTARRLVKEQRSEVLIVDYLQAARFDLAVQRYDKSVADLSKRLKGLCSQEKIPLIVTSQLRRGQRSPYSEPHISDVKESGDIENESEVVMLLWQNSDEPNAKCLGKIAKIKWSQPGLRFELIRDPAHGMITGLEEWKGKEDG